MHRIGVGNKLLQVGKCQLHGLDLQVLRQCRVKAGRLQVKVLQHAECHEGAYALAVGTDLMQRELAVAH